MPESQYALRALGYYPTEAELEATAKALGLPFPLASPAALQKVAESLAASTCKRGRPALPYAQRGCYLQQLSALWQGLSVNGWWHSLCAKFNEDHAAEIQAGTKFPMEPNLYSLDGSLSGFGKEQPLTRVVDARKQQSERSSKR